MKLAVVVQRYGADINGGAELHARYVAEHLSQHAAVDVLTTCARDYVTWRDDYPPGTEMVNDVPVRRADLPFILPAAHPCRQHRSGRRVRRSRQRRGRFRRLRRRQDGW